MAYKAVSTNESHIAHSTWKHTYGLHGSSTYQYVPTHNGIGNPHHGVGGMFTQNPAGNQSTSGNSTSTNPQPASTGGSTTNNTNSSSGSTANTNPTSTFNNTDSYRYQNPKNMTDAQLKEARDRAALEAVYNKYYPSRSEEFMKGAQQANQLVNQGAAFTKSLMPDKIYAAPLDLSNMTDEQLRAANNRAQLEMQYNQYFNPPKQNDAKKWVDIAATGMGLAISAAGVAVPIVIEVMRNKKGKG